jgi:pectinesterase
LQGDVDFIFGSGTAYFEECTIFSKKPGDRSPEDRDTSVYGYVTAASTHPEFPYGYVLHKCKLTSDCPKGSVYLGRPWKEWAKTVFLECELGEHIHPQGWLDWGKTHGHFYYGEYNSYGPGASPETRADFSHQLTREEAEQYSMEKVLEGWIGE